MEESAMPTVEQFIRNNPRHPVDPTRADQQIVNDLFASFCDLAKANWKYSASMAVGFNPHDVLAGDSTHPFSLNCMKLSGLFLEVVKSYFQDVLHRALTLAVKNSDCNPRNFVAPAGLTCFDAKVLGNVCTPTQGVAQVNRCLFSEHWFIKIGTTYYDPTFCTTYGAANDIVACQLDGAPTEYFTRGQKTRGLLKIVTFGAADSKGKFYTGTEGGQQYVFMRTGDQSYGFSETFLRRLRNTLSDDEKKRTGLA
jgi:hypothetical protein